MLWAGALFAVAGCALAPRANPRLEEARTSVAALRADAETVRLAPVQMERALEAWRSAFEAWQTLQDPALVDHLAYLAKQRAAIAVATARRTATQALVRRTSNGNGHAGERAE